MRRRLLLLALVSGISLFALGRIGSGARPALAAEPNSPAECFTEAAIDEDCEESEAAWRHRTCQPRHWRHMMLQR
jgi:hypothetical protein